jgi:hypothetical protein
LFLNWRLFRQIGINHDSGEPRRVMGQRNPLIIFPDSTSTQYTDIIGFVKNGALTDRHPTRGCQ